MDTYQLDAVTCAWIERHLAQRAAIEAAMQGALSLLCHQQGLNGRWDLDWPNRRIVRVDVPAKLEQVA